MHAPRPRRRLRDCRAGTAAVQFALVLPLFLLIFAGFVEFGRAIYTSTTLDNAVREAVRFAIVHGAASGSVATVDDIKAVVRKKVVALDPADLTATVTYAPNNDPGSTVTVQAAYSFAFFLPGFNLLGPIAFAKSASMVIAN